MNKSKPHHDLEKAKSLIRAGQYHVTDVALQGGRQLGIRGRKAIADFVLTLERSNFYKSMRATATIRNGWTFTTLLHLLGKHIYTKFSVVSDRAVVRIISFKEK